MRWLQISYTVLIFCFCLWWGGLEGAFPASVLASPPGAGRAVEHFSGGSSSPGRQHPSLFHAKLPSTRAGHCSPVPSPSTAGMSDAYGVLVIHEACLSQKNPGDC